MRNHYVPQFLQRPWTGVDGRLHQFHITSTAVHVTRKVPKQAGYKEDLLSLTRDEIAGMSKHAIEEIVLSRIDGDAAPVREKLAARQLANLTHEERCAWVRLIMSLRIRQPSMVSQLISQSADTLRSTLGSQPDEYDAIAGDDDPLSLEEWTERRFPGLIDNFGLSFFHTLIDNEAIGDKILKLTWWVFDLSLARHRLLLGDNPCLFTAGIDAPSLAVALPISPDKLFIATRGQNWATVLPTLSPDDIAKRMNESTVGQAQTYIYGCDDANRRFIENRRG